MGRIYALAVGNAFDGTRLYGPYPTSAVAGTVGEAGEKQGFWDKEWQVVELEATNARLILPTNEDSWIPTVALALQERVKQLEAKLKHLAEGARSKADVLASGSPTSKHYDPVQILNALAREALEGIGGLT